MKKKIIIIGADRKWEEDELLTATKQIGVEAEVWLSSDLQIALGEHEPQIFLGGRNVTDVFKQSLLIFRRTRGTLNYLIALAHLADQWGVVHLDSAISILNNLHKTQSMPTILTKNIQHVPTIFLRPDEKVKVENFQLEFPLVIKPADGRHGEGIEFLENENELTDFLNQNSNSFLLQKTLDIKSEYRVFVLGDESLGAVRKTPAENNRVANYASGAKFEKVDLPDEIVQEAILICQGQGIEIGGVDLALADDNWYLLEVNRCPEFKAFTSATGVNVAEKIVNYLLQK